MGPNSPAIAPALWTRLHRVKIQFPRYFFRRLRTWKRPKPRILVARQQTSSIGKSTVIKEELSCSEKLYVDGQVGSGIDPKRTRLTSDRTVASRPNVNASAVVVQGKLEADVQASDRVDLKKSAVVTG
jgi:cytoskeletal protein CcmA (bactofilin family)